MLINVFTRSYATLPDNLDKVPIQCIVLQKLRAPCFQKEYLRSIFLFCYFKSRKGLILSVKLDELKNLPDNP